MPKVEPVKATRFKGFCLVEGSNVDNVYTLVKVLNVFRLFVFRLFLDIMFMQSFTLVYSDRRAKYNITKDIDSEIPNREIPGCSVTYASKNYEKRQKGITDAV